MVIKKIQAKYDKQVREYKTSVRVYETEITKKPHIIKLYRAPQGLLLNFAFAI